MTRPRLVIRRPVLAAVLAHARAAYPLECCGVLYGPAGEAPVDEARPAANVQAELGLADADGRVRDAGSAFALDPASTLALARSLGGDRPARAVYHSHVNAGSYFSATDRAHALWDGRPAYPIAHVVVAVRQAGVAAAVWAWDDARRDFVEGTIVETP